MALLTEHEWERVLPLLRNIDPKRQQAAYNRLVLGMTLVEAGAPFGYSKQNVDIACKAVMRWVDKLNSVPDKPTPPPGWVAVEFMVPRSRVDEVRRVVEAMCPPASNTATKPSGKRARSAVKERPPAGAARKRAPRV
jgi:hypothetical protein